MNIGNKIYELRSAKNLSQGDLAELLEVSRQSVSKWETDNAVPELDKLIKMCEIFGVTLDELAGRSPGQAPKNDPCEQNESRSFTPQKLIGCVLIAVSFIAMVLTVLLAEGKDELYVLPRAFRVTGIGPGIIRWRSWMARNFCGRKVFPSGL